MRFPGQGPSQRPAANDRSRVTSAWIATALATLLLTGCSEEQAVDESPSPSSASGSATPTQTDDRTSRLARYLADAESHYAPPTGDNVSAAAPRPSIREVEGQEQTMIIRDVMEVSAAPGNYSLTVNCTGDGVVVASLIIGSYGTTEVLPDCTPATSTSQISLAVRESSDPTTVTIAPTGDTAAAIAYHLQKLS